MSITIVTGDAAEAREAHVEKLRDEGAVVTYDPATAYSLSRSGADVVLDNPFPGEQVKLVTVKPKSDEAPKKTATRK